MYALHCRVCTYVVDGVDSTLKYSYEISASTSVYLGGGWRGQGTGMCDIRILGYRSMVYYCLM